MMILFYSNIYSCLEDNFQLMYDCVNKFSKSRNACKKSLTFILHQFIIHNYSFVIYYLAEKKMQIF